jgi:hypothetical protein
VVLFLLVYDRTTASVSSIESVDVARLHETFDRRLEMELEALATGQDLEIVILEAPSEGLLHRSHARYFDDVRAVLTGQTA